jgi:hypothetical protein
MFEKKKGRKESDVSENHNSDNEEEDKEYMIPHPKVARQHLIQNYAYR